MTLTDTYSLRLHCRVTGWPRSTLYFQAQSSSADESLRQALQRLAGAWPTYGYRRRTVMLHREGHPVNGKRVRRLMAELGIKGKPPRCRLHTTNSIHTFPRYPNLVEGLDIIRPEQVWVADITYVRLRADFVYLAILMDVFTRRIRGWELSRSLDESLTQAALERALHCRRPTIHHSDQGVQYAATGYTDRLLEVGAAISMAAVGKPEENGYAERLMRTIKEEEVSLTEYVDFADAHRQLGCFLDDVYDRKRIHSALGYLTPAEFEREWRIRQPKERTVP
jgi:transposase InsO family protein